MGWFRIDDPEAPLVEGDTTQCAHCNAMVVIKASDKAKVTAAGFCTLCAWHTCQRCAGKACVPFMRKVERAEAKARLRMACG